MDRLIEPLKATCLSKAKANAVKQECEKQDELKRSALRAFLALLAIPDAGMFDAGSFVEKCILIVRFLFLFSDKNPLVTEFRQFIKNNPELNTLFEQIQKDSSSSANNNDAGTPMDVN